MSIGIQEKVESSMENPREVGISMEIKNFNRQVTTKSKFQKESREKAKIPMEKYGESRVLIES